MPDQVHFRIVTPEKETYEEDLEMVTVPTPGGPVGILPHHSHLMTKVVPGELHLKKGTKVTYMAVGEGLLEVSNGQATLMTDLAKTHEEINEQEVKEAQERAQKALQHVLSDEEYAVTIAALEKAAAQLRVKRRHRSV